MNKRKRTVFAAETLAIVERGWYSAASDGRVEIGPAVGRSVVGTRFIAAGDWEEIRGRAAKRAEGRVGDRPPGVEVTDETTLQAARRLASAGSDVTALNFASAKNPGGGFLGGSQAQEESLARSSALYPTLLAAREYYETNRACESAFYTDCAILSPGVPVFRDDDGTLLEEPYEVTFITAPAVNVSALRQQGRVDTEGTERTMARRIGNVLALAAAEGFETLVLGAWGCGVFGNDAEMIARLFAEAMATPVSRCFARVTFAAYDNRPDQPVLSAFRRHLAGAALIAPT